MRRLRAALFVGFLLLAPPSSPAMSFGTVQAPQEETPAPPRASELRARWGALVERIREAEKPEVVSLRRIGGEVLELARELEENGEGLPAASLLEYWGDALCGRFFRPDLALEPVARAKAAYRRAGETAAFGRVCKKRGNSLLALSRFADALKEYDAAADAFREVGDDAGLADIENNRGVGAMSLSKFDEALDAFAKAATHYERVGDATALAGIQANRGIIYSTVSRSDQALAAFAAAEEVFKKTGDEGRLARLWHNRGACHQAVSRFDEALEDYERAIAYFEQVGDRRSLAQIMENRGSIFSETSRHGEALTAYARAAEYFEQIGDARSLAHVHLNRGMAFYRISDFERALEAYDAAEILSRRATNRDALAKITLNRGMVYAGLSRFEEALVEYERARRYFERSGDELSLADVAQNRGSVYAMLHRHDEALEAFDIAVSWFRKIGDERRTALLELNMGATYRRMLRFEDALRAFDQAQVRLEKLNERTGLARLRVNRGNVLRWLSRYEEALEELSKAERYYRAERIERGQATVAWNRGNVLSSMRRFEDALAEYSRAEVCFERIGNTGVLSVIAQNRGIALSALGRHQEALAVYRVALERVECHYSEDISGLGDVSSMQFRRTRAWLPAAVASCALALRRAGIEDEGEKAAYRALEIISGRSVANRLIAARVGSSSRDLETRDRERLSEILVEIRQALERWEQASARGDVDEVSEVVTVLERLDRERSRIFETLRGEDPVVANGVRPRVAPVGAVIDELPEGSALLELAMDTDRGFAWGFVIHEGGFEMVPLGDADEVTRCLERLRRQGATRPSATLLRDLGRLLLDPLLDELPSGSSRPQRLYVALHGALARVPVGILLTADVAKGVPERDWPYLGKDFTISQVPSASTWLSMRRAPRRTPSPDDVALYVLGFPFDRDSELAEIGGERPDVDRSDVVLRGRDRGVLFGAGQEALAIARLFAGSAKGRECLDEAEDILDEDELSRSPKLASIAGTRFVVRLRTGANEQAFKTDAKLTSAGIVHMACHGEADLTSPILSRLVLARSPVLEERTGEDGYLYVSELAERELTADLLVLSACESNEGTLHPAEGLQSLAYAGLLAGARSVISTLWRVEDDAARDMMVDFYRRLLTGKHTRAEALTRAKRAALERGAPVRTWAAYVLWDAE